MTDSDPAGRSELRFCDLSVYLPDADALVLADLHVGREEAAGVDVPLGEADDLGDRLAALLDRFEPATVVFAGDVLHHFSHVSASIRATIEALWAVCEEKGSEAIAVEGNHDRLLAECWPGAVESAFRLSDGTVVCHGHEEPEPSGEQYLVGHDHPAIAIEGVRRPCYLFAESGYRGADLLVLPAFTRLADGVEINRRRGADFQSPLVTSLRSMRPIVWDADRERALWFPPLDSFRRLL